MPRRVEISSVLVAIKMWFQTLFTDSHNLTHFMGTLKACDFKIFSCLLLTLEFMKTKKQNSQL